MAQRMIVIDPGHTISKTPLGAWIPGTPTYTKNLAIKARASNNAILKYFISWIMAGCLLPGAIFISGSGTITATSIKCLCDGVPPLRQEDNGLCIGSFMPVSPPFTPIPCSCRFTITNAGQNKVMGE